MTCEGGTSLLIFNVWHSSVEQQLSSNRVATMNGCIMQRRGKTSVATVKHGVGKRLREAAANRHTADGMTRLLQGRYGRSKGTDFAIGEIEYRSMWGSCEEPVAIRGVYKGQL